MASKSPVGYLQRKKIVRGIADNWPRPRHVTCTLRSHFRPTEVLSTVQPTDEVATRLKTEPNKDRLPFIENLNPGDNT